VGIGRNGKGYLLQGDTCLLLSGGSLGEEVVTFLPDRPHIEGTSFVAGESWDVDFHPLL